jgi:hypothetical protein
MKLRKFFTNGNRRPTEPGPNDRGQSMVEFVVVLTALFLVAGLGRGYITQLKDVIQQKYRSYCFGIAISDPPPGSYQGMGVTEDAAHTMQLSEQMERMSSAASQKKKSQVPADQAATRGDVLDFMEQSQDL